MTPMINLTAIYKSAKKLLRKTKRTISLADPERVVFWDFITDEKPQGSYASYVDKAGNPLYRSFNLDSRYIYDLKQEDADKICRIVVDELVGLRSNVISFRDYGDKLVVRLHIPERNIVGRFTESELDQMFDNQTYREIYYSLFDV